MLIQRYFPLTTLLLTKSCYGGGTPRSIKIASDLPDGASALVNKNFVALSIEPSSFVDFTGISLLDA
jgi:hypothetical protein